MACLARSIAFNHAEPVAVVPDARFAIPLREGIQPGVHPRLCGWPTSHGGASGQV